jgi:hypothetical protein
MSGGRVLGVVCAGVVLEVPVGDVMGAATVEVVGRGGVGVVKASLQTEAPAAEYVPAGQKRQMTSEFAPIVGEYLPAGQDMQANAVVAPVAVKNLPALQSVHPALPVTILYFPAAQAEHVPPFGPVKPRLQTQLLNAVEPLTDCELLGQEIQLLLATAPTLGEYVLTPQFKQVLAVVAPVIVEYVPAGQSRQMTSEFAPIVGEYLPALQSVHPALPVTILYFPAAQAEHVPPFGPVKPRLQTQLLNAVEPLTDCELLGQEIQLLLATAPTLGEYVLTPQFKQVLAVVAPVIVEYLPMGQKVQTSEPAELLYVPAAQLTQFPPLRVIPGAHSGPPQYMRRSYVIRFRCEINSFCTLQYMATIASTDNKSTFILICKSRR